MDKDKNTYGKKPFESKDDQSDVGARARNRTVMLTPEVTGQVRALLNQDEEPAQKVDDFAPVTGLQNNPGLGGLKNRETKGTQAAGLSQAHRDATPTNVPIDQSLVQSARQQPAGVSLEKATRLVGFLVSFDGGSMGEVIDLRVGRWIVSSEKGADGNFLIIKHQTVSPFHAIIKISETKEIQVLDQLSEFGTTVKKADGTEQKLSGSVALIAHGDSVKFGSRNFNVCLIQEA
jgi:hypothetical protein